MHMSTVFLTPPAREFFDVDPYTRIPTVRSGPDRLPESLIKDFASAPAPVTAAAYWYREHFYCCEPGCDCNELGVRLGEGFCLVMYGDGHFGVLKLMERLKSEDHLSENVEDAFSGLLIDWKEPETRVDGEILASISRWGLNTVNMTSLGAYTGMWMAHAHAVSCGIFPPLQQINPLDSGPSARVRKHLKNRQRTR